MWYFLGGFIYGIIFLCTFVYFLFMNLVVYVDQIGDLYDYEYEEVIEDSIDQFIELVMLLGFARTIAWVILALLWPLSLIVFFFIPLYFGKEKHLDDLPVGVQRTVRWVLLGFGKFAPSTSVK